MIRAVPSDCLGTTTGAIMAQGFTDVSIYDSSFQATSSGGDGGAVAVEGSKLQVELSHFSHCVASESGGTISPTPATSRSGPSSCQDSDSRSARTAGAVSGGEYAHSVGVEASSITLSASSFEGCERPAPTVFGPTVLGTMSLRVSRLDRSLHFRVWSPCNS